MTNRKAPPPKPQPLKAQKTNAQHDPEKTLNDPLEANPMHLPDENRRHSSQPKRCETSPTQATSTSPPWSNLSKAFTQGLNSQMTDNQYAHMHQDNTSDMDNTEWEAMNEDEDIKFDLIHHAKSKMEELLELLISLKDSSYWDKLEYAPWLDKLTALEHPTAQSNPTEPLNTQLVESIACLTRKIDALEHCNHQHTVHTLRDPMTTATPMTRPAKPSWASITEKPAKPTNKPTNQTIQTLSQLPPDIPTADPHCLIIRVSPPILKTDKPNSIEAQAKINKMLEKKDVPHNLHVMAIGYSRVGNIKVTMTHSCKALDLMKYSKDIANIVMKNEVLSAILDKEHYCVKINKVPMWCGNEEPLTIQMVHKELCTYVLEYNTMKQWRVPHWLGSEDTICAKNSASVVIDLTNKSDRDVLLNISCTQLFNLQCTIMPYKDCPQVFVCCHDPHCHWPFPNIPMLLLLHETITSLSSNLGTHCPSNTMYRNPS